MTAIRPFKVTDFGTDRKPVLDFLLVNDKYLLVLSFTVSELSRRMLIKLSLLTGCGASDSITRCNGEPWELWIAQFGLDKLETSTYREVHNMFGHIEPFIGCLLYTSDAADE